MNEKLHVIILMLLFYTTIFAQDEVSNVVVRQEKNDVIIIYDLRKDADITLEISWDNNSFQKVDAVSGDVGKSVSQGNQKRIVFSPLKQFGDTFIKNNVRFRINAVIPKPIKPAEPTWWENGLTYFPNSKLEVYYGLDYNSIINHNFKHYIGMQYSFIPHTFGFNLSGMYGFNNGDIVATAGPALTMTNGKHTDLSLDLLIGGGMARVKNDLGLPFYTWAAEAGLRFDFEAAVTGTQFSWWSLYFGAKYYNKQIVPTVGISLQPIGVFVLGQDYFFDVSDHPHIFLDPISGYNINGDDWLFGGHFAWQTFNTGLYATFMYGIWEGTIVSAIGPAFHITPNADLFDLTIYGGAGYGRKSTGQSAVVGDFGLRFGFSRRTFSCWEIGIGCSTFGDEWIPTVSCSLPIGGMVGGTGAIIWLLTML